MRRHEFAIRLSAGGRRKGDILRIINGNQLGSCAFCGQSIVLELAVYDVQDKSDELGLEVPFCDAICAASWERVQRIVRSRPRVGFSQRNDMALRQNKKVITLRNRIGTT